MTTGPAGPADASVIVCTRDRPDMLETLLKSLAAHLPAAMEVLVVDSASVEPTTREVAEAAGVRYTRLHVPGLSLARNHGTRLTSSEIVVFTDDDCEVTSGWVEGLVAGFADRRVGVVTGPMVDVLPDAVVAPTSERASEALARRHFSTVFSGVDLGHGANMAFRRRAISEVGFFDTRLGAGTDLAGAEDLDMFCRLIRDGWWARYEPSPTVVHRNPRSAAGLVQLHRGYGRGLGAMAAKTVRTTPVAGVALSARLLVRSARGVLVAGRRGRWERRAALAGLAGLVSGAASGARLPLSGDVFAAPGHGLGDVQ